jgi:hypothetical protein
VLLLQVVFELRRGRRFLFCVEFELERRLVFRLWSLCPRQMPIRRAAEPRQWRLSGRALAVRRLLAGSTPGLRLIRWLGLEVVNQLGQRCRLRFG